MDKNPASGRTALSLEIKSLHVHFLNKSIFKNFSLRVSPGEKVSLSGPSGSGKSTLMNCIMGFVRPQKGSVRIHGTLLDQNSVWALRRHLGFVPQEPRLGPGEVAGLLSRPFTYHSNRELKLDENHKKELFDIFQVEKGILQKNTTELSGGEKQRVTLISALLLKRSIYLLDEITSALDNINSARVIDYLKSQKDLTLLFSSHDEMILRASDRIVRLNPRAQKENGPNEIIRG